ncbi:MAG: hypothetical protein HQ546_04945 [Planctomycetes bacterium]|nr:hypothetical protein [Planctomycetota bacterium]
MRGKVPEERPQRREIGRRGRMVLLGICLGTGLILLAVVWAVPRPIGDLYVGLAGGRDIVEGRLGQPDDWCFTTAGRVWINQNWGTHLLYYLSNSAMGETGLLVFKALLLVGMVSFIALTGRQRGVGWPMALLTSAAMALAGYGYIDLRPNLMSLMFTPLLVWLLYRSRGRPHRIWLAMLAVLIWANVHGGFIFGLGMLWLWALCQFLPTAVREGVNTAVRRHWPLPAAAMGGVLLTAIVNPFGLANLLHPFVVGRSDVWRRVSEWRPIFCSGIGFGTVKEFFVVVCLSAGLSVWQLLARLRTPRRKKAGKCKALTAQQVGTALFDLVLAGIVIAMAVKARRFVPMVFVVLGPFLAGRLEWALRVRRHIVPTAVAAGLVLALAVHMGLGEVRHYRLDNPLRERETFAQRMIFFSSNFPGDAAEFLAANDITGRVYNDWRWEGYLRWRCPKLKLWIGGRAQQVHDEKTYLQAIGLAIKPSQEVLSENDVHLVVIPGGGKYAKLIRTLTMGPQALWAVIYFDGYNLVLADVTVESTRGLIGKILAGQLQYPDEGIAALSRAMCLTSSAVRTKNNVLRQALLDAARLRPSPQVYAVLGGNTRKPPREWRKLTDYLELESRRLADQTVEQAGGIRLLMCRIDIANILSELYESVGEINKARRWETARQELRELINDVGMKWSV